MAQSGMQRRMSGMTSGSQSGKAGSKDSLTHRNPLEDSITINYRYFDSSRPVKIDSSINDFYTRFPVPYYYTDLGNNGTAAHSLLFTPIMKPGFDAGFHSFDIYKYTLENTKFYQTTRPYTELAYMIGKSSEQLINILHTQNRKSRFNFAFDFRLINSPGAFKNQNTSHSNLRVNTFYQSDNKRYGLYLIYFSNALKSAENGGLITDSSLQNLSLGDPFEADTRLGSALSDQGRNFFNTNILLGTTYKETNVFLRHYYDFGQKDSIVQDSVTIKLFYPRLRLQHTMQYSTNEYQYNDQRLDSNNYVDYFNYNIDRNDSVNMLFQDKWRSFTNEFSIITYPDKKNTAQFLKLSASLQLLKGTFYPDTLRTENFNSTFVSAEYRNRTKNKKWDIEATGSFYVTGPFSGDYSAYISLQRELSKKLGSLEVGFQNVNKSPSALSSGVSSFPMQADAGFNKTNITRIFANVYLPAQDLKLVGNYYGVANYIYYTDFLKANQQGALFNVLSVGLEKKFRLSRYFNYYVEAYFQQAPGNAPVHIPAFFSRHRIAFEGNFFTNLFLSTGLEVRYYTPYKADTYSPLNGQFIYQDDATITNRPDVNVFMHFRIKSFKGFVRLENVNSLDKNGTEVGFTRHNFSAPHYAQNALWIRVGIWWNFVN